MNSCEHAADDTEGDGAAVASTTRRKRTWEEASDEEEQDPEAAEAARKEAEMEADRSELVTLSALGLPQGHTGCCDASHSPDNCWGAI